ncbi:hypothetical protein SAMN04488540_101199 [Ferrimonas sediminum]|uniref:Uncharacterized protein n=1 Tax=Ferrimonas sediminum TaxID=718193 RepID=A0A1G8JYV2_9GAMM|nr:hypothetical protein [Ferrimonas sediminum]SDI36364.1 hypothetical protein SAMN04488540_101199 [Ferrimonas sediminum]
MESKQSRMTARECRWFIADDEDEQVDDTLRSCVNCAYRRWLQQGYRCVHPLKQLNREKTN